MTDRSSILIHHGSSIVWMRVRLVIDLLMLGRWVHYPIRCLVSWMTRTLRLFLAIKSLLGLEMLIVLLDLLSCGCHSCRVLLYQLVCRSGRLRRTRGSSHALRVRLGAA